MNMSTFLAFCDEWHGGQESTLFKIKQRGDLVNHVTARLAYKEVTQDLLHLQGKIKASEKGTPTYYGYRRDLEACEDAMDFIRLRFPDVT